MFGYHLRGAKLAEEVTMDIGYIKRAHMNMSEIGELYIEEIKKYVGM